MSDALNEQHNRLAGELIAAIVRAPQQVGGDYRHSLVLLESVIAGTLHVLAKLGGDEIVVDHVVIAAKERLAQLRLGDIEAGGNA